MTRTRWAALVAVVLLLALGGVAVWATQSGDDEPAASSTTSSTSTSTTTTAPPLDGAVGATRAVTDLGWRPHHEQIGQTGKVVRPKLYVGVGVSGAVQHTVGMQNAETVVVINRDKDAPLFKLAEIGVVGDLNEIVPALTREIKVARGK